MKTVIAALLYLGLFLSPAYSEEPEAGDDIKVLIACGTLKGVGTVYVKIGDEVQTQSVVCPAQRI